MASPGGYYYAPPPPRPRSLAGPLILIGIGVIFLLRNFGYSIPIMHNFVRYWPVLLLVIGVVRLVEYFYARSSGRPAPVMGGGSVFLLVMVIVFGLSATAIMNGREHINFGNMPDDFQVDDNFMHWFGNEYSYSGDVNAPMPENGALRVNCERGNVTVNKYDGNEVRATWRKRVFASGQGEADSTNQSTLPRFQTTGTTVELQVNTEGAGQKGVVTDVEILLPVKAELQVTNNHGEVHVQERTAPVKIVASHGDVSVDQLTGDAKITARHGSLHVTNVNGNVSVDGRLDDLTLDSIKGTALVTTDIFGDTRLGRLEKGITIRTSRTTLEIAKLDGELTMDSGDLKGDHLLGPVTLTTKAKDVELREVKGDLHIADDHGDISLETGSSAALGNLDLMTHHGDVHLRLPSKAAFQYDLSTRHGDITNDFGSSASGKNGNSSSTNGSVGRGGVKVKVVSDTGDISLGKTEESISAPPAPAAPPAPPATPKQAAPAKPGSKKVDQVPVM